MFVCGCVCLHAVVLVCVRSCCFALIAVLCAFSSLYVLVFVYVYKQHKHKICIPLYAFVCVLQVLDGPFYTTYIQVLLTRIAIPPLFTSHAKSNFKSFFK